MLPRLLAWIGLVTCTALCPLSGASAEESPPTPPPRPSQEVVDKAVARGAAWLRKEQKRDGSYGTMPGETALALLTLRHSGIDRDDKKCRRAASNLERSLPDGSVYGAGLGIMALLAQDPVLHLAKVEELVGELVRAQCVNGQWTYAYRSTKKKKRGDNSNSQFAVLGLAAARAHRVEVPVETFKRCRVFLETTQNDDGGWGYSDKERASSYASMTAGGAMILAFSAAAEQGVPAGSALLKETPSLRRALAWLGDDFDPKENRGAGRAFGPKRKRSDSFWRHYWLWSVERAGAATGAAKLGKHDWYAEGANQLLGEQRKVGSWRGPETELRATCFALLFFGRSTKRAITPRDPSPPVITPR